MMVRSRAPGRVNVIGDHTDYTGGLVLPMAIELATTVDGRRGGDFVSLVSDRADGEARVPIDIAAGDVSGVEPDWARYIAAVVAEVRPAQGFTGKVTTSLPIGGGLSSSAALEVAVALALGYDGDPLATARLCQRAEWIASGVPCGIMDQLAATAAVEGALLLIDCRSFDVEPVELHDSVAVVGVDSGQARTLAGSAYATRRAECEAAQRDIGPLRDASLEGVRTLRDGVLRRRARHVVTENTRVAEFVQAIREQRYTDAGAHMDASHLSLRDDFEVSTPGVDDLVGRVRATPGVYGARMTGGGFGGFVVALCDARSSVAADFGGHAFAPAAGATVELQAPRPGPYASYPRRPS